MTNSLGLAKISPETPSLSSNLIAAVRQTPEGVFEGENFARLIPIRLATAALREQYVGVGGWTEESEAIEVSRIDAVGDGALWFHPTSGKRLGRSDEAAGSDAMQTPEKRLADLGVKEHLVADKAGRLRASNTLQELKQNVCSTYLSVEQFLSHLFKNLYPQVQERVLSRLQPLGMTPTLASFIFVTSAGEPFLPLVFGHPSLSPEDQRIYTELKPEGRDAFCQEVAAVMFEELKRYLFS
ncbi:hypothetical protein A3A67_04570 [Candidatus Peribacteria bacterium RIFCSPLOWO2_01_FULL_51_18]|nr:MAG: hypothetical protein A3C52_03285 [Candidatus Peribacteria bacterium RIFCSPHIGHO2_02_FULL_51_15]OGJ66682.1 MAG: hypothetical protein A3A67_04570 [Candidatus Peribacteria bacterium RIFCSPLOWO2_01_FULL_51_18]OGJ69786.1 MAG: hypothetical protein A3J34_04890 [Candidatus Peribacteria bacterium RIFCSPLOWO2_02_FULL_51_10]